ncbi:MAG: YdcF family protein [Candidatus Promineifilaceae bacterium]
MAVIRLFLRSTMWVVLLSVVLVSWSAADIALFSQRTDTIEADAAVVLGAAVYGSRPSPIFRERINHGIALYESGQVHALIFTGGQGRRDRLTEAEVGRQYAIQRGVPADDIFLETHSTNTAENLAHIVEISAENNLNKLLIVSTPFHQRRAVYIAHRLGLDAYTSPTRTTRWLGTGTRQHLFTREVGAYLYYRLFWNPLTQQVG